MNITDDPKIEYDRACALVELVELDAVELAGRVNFLRSLLENGDFLRAGVNACLAGAKAESIARSSDLIIEMLEVIDPERGEGENG